MSPLGQRLPVRRFPPVSRSLNVGYGDFFLGLRFVRSRALLLACWPVSRLARAHSQRSAPRPPWRRRRIQSITVRTPRIEIARGTSANTTAMASNSGTWSQNHDRDQTPGSVLGSQRKCRYRKTTNAAIVRRNRTTARTHAPSASSGHARRYAGHERSATGGFLAREYRATVWNRRSAG